MISSLLCLALAACGGGSSVADSEVGSPQVLAAPATPSTLAAANPNTTVSSSTPPAGQSTAGAAADPTPSVPAQQLTFSFDLLTSRTTSAGVFAADGNLVRTLWRGERVAAGRHTRSWDHRLDSGALAAAGNYTVGLVHHDIQYQWDGVVGNTSAVLGRAPHRSFLPPMSLAADGLQLHMGLGYNEVHPVISGLRVDDPQRPAPQVSHVDPFIGAGLVASDGRQLFIAHTGGIHRGGFVFAINLADGRKVVFAQGQAQCLNTWPNSSSCYPDQDYRSVLAARPPGEPQPTGLAVQRQGDLLAVAYGLEDLVRVYNKQTGQLLTQWSVPLSTHSRNHLAMAANGDLWVVSGTSVLRYSAIDGQPRLVQTLSGLSRPLALAADPVNEALVWVADGGDSQQVKRFDRSGLADRVIGQRGGLSAQTAVGTDRLCFAFDAQRENTALAVDGQDQLWVVDTCNNRLLRFAADGRFTEAVAWLPGSYVSAVDSQRPQRVFANFLEFEVDYGRALNCAPGSTQGSTPCSEGGWRLIRNWLPSLPAALRDTQSQNYQFGGFRGVTTLSNGRTLAQLDVAGRVVIAELLGGSPVKELLRLPAPASGASPWVMHANGDLLQSVDEGNSQVVVRRRLEGFDAGGSPRWASAATALASVPRTAGSPYHRMGTFAGLTGPRLPLTDSGKLILFNPAVDPSDGMHLGAVSLGASDWAWQASPSGAMDGRGSFQTRSSDSQIHYGGNVAMSSGRSVLYGYHGEFFTDPVSGRMGQANQFMHFLDNGLFVGQFGALGVVVKAVPEAGRSGNAFSPTLVNHAGRTYLYHNDESSWAGVHRWELKGLNDLVELKATASLGSTTSLR
ncbi:MAG: hypothetical protein ACKVOT_06075 [Polaromonas sp.]